MKKKILIPIIVLVALSAGAVTYVTIGQSKVPKVSENITISHFIDTMMKNQRILVSKMADTNSSEYRLTKLGFTSKSGITLDEYTSKAVKVLYEVYDSIYPKNQFINFKGVNDLLTEYGLFLGSADLFICDIPQRELDAIEKFRISYLYDRASSYGVQDLQYKIEDLATMNNGYGPLSGYIKYIYTPTTEGNGELSKTKDLVEYSKLDMKKRSEKTTSFLLIAPRTCFKGEPNESGNFGEIKDPIVLAPVEGGYIIVTAW